MKNTVPTVDKAIALLERLGRVGPATQAELARELGLTASTCYRILQTLQHRDWARRTTGGKHELSNGVMALLGRMTDRVSRFECCQPLLDSLAANTGLAVKLSLRSGDEQVGILRSESLRPIAVAGRVGTRFPLVEGSVGAALLSAESAVEIRRLAAGCREDIAERSFPEQVVKRVGEVRRLGYFFSAKDNRWGVNAMSAPVKMADGSVVAAVTVLGFDTDFLGSERDAIAARLCGTAAECASLVS